MSVSGRRICSTKLSVVAGHKTDKNYGMYLTIIGELSRLAGWLAGSLSAVPKNYIDEFRISSDQLPFEKYRHAEGP